MNIYETKSIRERYEDNEIKFLGEFAAKSKFSRGRRIEETPSLSRFTTEEDIDYTCRVMPDIISKINKTL